MTDPLVFYGSDKKSITFAYFSSSRKVIFNVRPFTCVFNVNFISKSVNVIDFSSVSS
jgi:hypothetical protein